MDFEAYKIEVLKALSRTRQHATEMLWRVKEKEIALYEPYSLLMQKIVDAEYFLEEMVEAHENACKQAQGTEP